MAEGERISAPAGSTGLMRFYDVSASKIQLDPKLVVGFAALLIAIEVIIQTFAR